MLFLIISGLLSHLFQKNLLSKIFYSLFFLIFIISAVLPTGRFMYYNLEKNFHNQYSLPKTFYLSPTMEALAVSVRESINMDRIKS